MTNFKETEQPSLRPTLFFGRMSRQAGLDCSGGFQGRAGYPRLDGPAAGGGYVLRERQKVKAAPAALRASLTLPGQPRHAGAGRIIKGESPCQIWKSLFANVPTTSGSPTVNPRARRTCIG